MRATFSSAAASATDVPPNFITIDIYETLAIKKGRPRVNTTDLFWRIEIRDALLGAS
jgi:hypothetical protein